MAYHPDGAAGRVLATMALLETNFKNIRRREAAFQTQKLAAIDKMLHRRAALERCNDESTSTSVRPRSTAAPQKGRRVQLDHRPATCPQGPSTNGSMHVRSMSSPGLIGGDLPPHMASSPVHPLAVNRFCASMPVSRHPAPHPGAGSLRPHRPQPRRALSAFLATEPRPLSPSTQEPPPSLKARASMISAITAVESSYTADSALGHRESPMLKKSNCPDGLDFIDEEHCSAGAAQTSSPMHSRTSKGIPWILGESEQSSSSTAVDPGQQRHRINRERSHSEGFVPRSPVASSMVSHGTRTGANNKDVDMFLDYETLQEEALLDAIFSGALGGQRQCSKQKKS